MKCVFFSVAIFCSMVSSAFAITDVIKLDAITDADMTYIQRGWSPQTGACATNLIDEIKSYDEPNTPWTVVLDDSKDVIVFRNPKDKNLYHICDNGKQFWVERGKKQLMQRYNKAGKPTMMEP